jgi:hypothetical protein
MKQDTFITVCNIPCENSHYAYWLTALQGRVMAYVSQLCTQKEGFVLDVLDVVVSNVRASPWGYLICDARCKVKCYLPRAGQELRARVHKVIMNAGMYCVYLKADILIPWREVMEAGCTGHEGNEIVCRVTQVRYQNGKWRCIASLIK